MPKILVIFILLSSFFLALAPASAQDETAKEYIAAPRMSEDQMRQELRMTKAGQVAQIIDPLRVQLHDGTIIQLASLDIPDMNVTDSGEHALAARDFLQEFLDQQPVRLYQTKNADTGRENRMGYQLGHLVRKSDEAWVQGTLLSNGLARILPTTRNLELTTDMIALEDEARAAGRGLWADPAYAILTPDNAAQGLNGWAIIEGKPLKIATVKNTVYLNFGADWRSDFTIVVEPTVRKKLAQSGIDVMNLAGKTVRVRGWVEDYNGPSIKLSAAPWLEVRARPAPER